MAKKTAPAKQAEAAPAKKAAPKKPANAVAAPVVAEAPAEEPKPSAKPSVLADLKPGQLFDVYDHAVGKIRKMRTKQYEVLKNTQFTKDGKKFLRYTLGNAPKAVVTKND